MKGLTQLMLVLLLAIITATLMVIASYQQAIASPITPSCSYEGAECPNTQHYLRDYQLEFHYDTLWIYDGDRLVGITIDTSFNHGKFIDSTILKDNL